MPYRDGADFGRLHAALAVFLIAAGTLGFAPYVLNDISTQAAINAPLTRPSDSWFRELIPRYEMPFMHVSQAAHLIFAQANQRVVGLKTRLTTRVDGGFRRAARRRERQASGDPDDHLRTESFD